MGAALGLASKYWMIRMLFSALLSHLTNTYFSNLEAHLLFRMKCAKEIIKLGYNGALEKAALLKPLSLGEDEWAAHLAARRARMRPDTPPVPDVVTVNVDDDSRSRAVALEVIRPTS